MQIQLLVLLFTYIHCEPSPTAKYVNKAILVAPDVYILYWNYTDTDITFEIHAKTTGWVGFGISPNGDMINSDVIIAWINSNGIANFTERNTQAGYVTPSISTQQLWTPLLTVAQNGYIISKSTRKLKLCDTTGQHMDIESGTPHVIFSCGDSFSNNDAAYHGPNNRDTKSLPLISSLNANITINMSQVQTVDFKVNVITINFNSSKHKVSWAKILFLIIDNSRTSKY